MKGHIIVDKESGRRHIYVPEAHIQFYAILNGHEEWVVCPFRTDGLYGRTRETAIPTTEHLKHAYQFTTELDVPEHIVKFAVESERRRQESVAGMEQILKDAVQTGNKKLGFDELMAQIKFEKSDEDFGQDMENRIGEEIDKMLRTTGGLQ